jgi:hypothetical protein
MPSDAPASPFATLAAVLAGVTRPGDFCTSGSVVTPIPRIDVEGVGTVAFPLPPSQARELIAAAEAAPYGRGAETLVDRDVRRAWQLSPGRVRLDDPRWERTVEAIVAKAAAGLGVEGAVTAELYKLLVYDAGGFFVPHRDTEKAPTMFGTLVVVLPSTFAGGELIVRHAGRETVLELPGEDVACVAYGAFYSDCVHELRPITEGYRVCLVYNLVRRGGARPVAPDNSREIEAVAGFLGAWARGEEEDEDEAPSLPDKLVHVLEHHYTPAELSFAGLKNRDAAVASVVRAAAARADAVVHLAMVSIVESGTAEPHSYGGYDRWRDYSYDKDEDEDDEDDSYDVAEVMYRVETVDGWVRTDDIPAALGALPIHEDELYPPGALHDEDPDESHLHEATGNGGASFDRTYRRAALVVWPRAWDRSIRAQAPLASLVKQLGALVDAGDPGARADARALATHVVGALSRDGAARLALLGTLVRLGDAGLFLRFAQERLPVGFAAAEIAPLLAGYALVGGDALAATVTSICAVNAPAHAGVCLALLDALAALDPAAARRAAPALLARLPRDPAAETHLHASHQPLPDAAWLGGLLGLLLRLGEPALLDRAVAYAVAHLAPDHLDTVVLPALLRVWTPGAPALAPLHAACVAHIRGRLVPLTPPTDWRRDAPVTCRCVDCATLRNFLEAPHTPRWEFRAVQERRAHVEQALWGRDVDTQTLRKGSPHTLVCVKNQRSYERRVEQRRGDEAALARLGG